MLFIGLNVLVLEKRNKLHFIKLFNEIKNLNQHNLSHKYFKLFCIKSKLSVSALIIISYSVIILFYVIYGLLFCLQFFYYNSYSFKFHHMIWYLLVFITMNYGTFFSFMLFYVNYMTCSYLKYRYRKIYEIMVAVALKPLELHSKLISGELKFIIVMMV